MAKRFRRIKRKGVRLTKRDLQVVLAVFEARYMTNRLIARLLFKPTTFSWCKQRIRYLFDLGYLGKRKAYVNEPDVYYLGLEGKRYIVSLGEHAREEVDKMAGVSGGRATAPILMMNHDLTLSRLYVNARLQCRRYGWEMRWRNTRMLETARMGIEPDAWIEVRNRGKRKASFVEFTAAMPTGKELAGKIEGYEGYWERTCDPVPVLWLTTSRSKASRLKSGILKSEYRDYFLVGLIEDAGGFLTEPMWEWSESEERIRWASPPQEAINEAGGRH